MKRDVAMMCSSFIRILETYLSTMVMYLSLLSLDDAIGNVNY